MNIRIFLGKNNVSEDEIYEIEKFFQEEEIKEILNKNKINLSWKIIWLIFFIIFWIFNYYDSNYNIKDLYFILFSLLVFFLYILIISFFRLSHQENIDTKALLTTNLQNFLKNKIIYEEKENKIFISWESKDYILDWKEFYEEVWNRKHKRYIFNKNLNFKLKDYKEEELYIHIPSSEDIFACEMFIFILLWIITLYYIYWNFWIGFLLVLWFWLLGIILCVLKIIWIKKEIYNIKYNIKNQDEENEIENFSNKLREDWFKIERKSFEIDYSEEKKILVDFYLENKNIKTLTFSNNKLSLELYFSWGYTKYWVLHVYIFLKKVDDLIKRLKSIKHFSR